MRGTEAVDLIRDQMAKTKDEYISMMGEVMTEYLRLHPEAEIDKDKTLQGAFDHLKAEAKKKQKGGCYAMPPKEIFAGMMLYYDLVPEDGDAMRCFAAAMGQAAPNEKVVLLREAYRQLTEQFKAIEKLINEVDELEPATAERYRVGVAKGARLMADRLVGSE